MTSAKPSRGIKSHIFSSHGKGINSPRERSDSTSSDEQESSDQRQAITYNIILDTDPKQTSMGQFKLVYQKEDDCYLVEASDAMLLCKKQVILGLMELVEEKASKMAIKIDDQMKCSESLKKMLKIVGFSEHAKTESGCVLVVELAS